MQYKGEESVRTYEVVFVAAPTLTSEELDAFISHIQTVVESRNGKVVNVDNWGKRSLAYKIKKFRDAYYVVLTVEGDGGAIAELERRFRVTDSIIRFISVRLDLDLKRSEKLKAMREKSTAARASAEPRTGAGPESAPL
jgi:small subunit ribosomal protein S6